MINKKRLLENLQNNKKAIFEYSIAALSNMSDSKRKGRSTGITSFYKFISQGPDGQTWTNWTVPSQSDAGKNYRVIVEIDTENDGGFIALAKQKISASEMVKTIAKSDVKVYCSCPDFYWGGAKYNLGPNGKYGNPNVSGVAGQTEKYKYDQGTVTHAPDIRDPNREHVLCKHCIAVSKTFPWNATQIFKDAKAYDAKIATSNEVKLQTEDGLTPLAKDIKLLDVPSEVKTDIINPIESELEKDSNSVVNQTQALDTLNNTIDNEVNEFEDSETDLVDEVNKTQEEPIEHNADNVINDKNDVVDEVQNDLEDNLEPDVNELDNSEELKKEGASNIINNKNEVVNSLNKKI